MRLARKVRRRRETAEQFSDRISALCAEINTENRVDDACALTREAQMLAAMKAMRLHIDRIGREKRVIALHAAGKICPEGKENCPLQGLRPPSDCASCWELYAAKKIRGE